VKRSAFLPSSTSEKQHRSFPDQKSFQKLRAEGRHRRKEESPHECSDRTPSGWTGFGIKQNRGIRAFTDHQEPPSVADKETDKVTTGDRHAKRGGQITIWGNVHQKRYRTYY